MRDPARTGRVLWAAAAALLLGVAQADPAPASTLVGSTFTPTVGCSASPATFVQDASAQPSYVVPFDGVITAWTFHAPSPPVPEVRLKVVRDLGFGMYRTVAESERGTPAPDTVNTYPTRIAVTRGDLLGLAVFGSGSCAGPAPGPGFSVSTATGDVPVGSATTYVGPFADTRVDVSAELEPDCDSDGEGDETQDPVADCAPPETTLTRQPKSRVRRKLATFEFTAGEPGSTFECSLNGSPFSACSSPHTLKARKGRNRFEVRAKDAAGNVDVAPAVAMWRFKKARKRR